MKQPAKSRKAALTIGPLVVLATTLGCDDGSAMIAREAANRQAEQNRTMAKLHQEVAAGSRQLVEEEGQARRQALEVHRDLAAGQDRLAAGWDDVESQRRQIARSRRTESFWAAVLPPSGGVIAAAVALGFAWVVLSGLRGDDHSSELACQLLVEQFVPIEPTVDRAELPSPQIRLAGLLSHESTTAPAADPSTEENP